MRHALVVWGAVCRGVVVTPLPHRADTGSTPLLPPPPTHTHVAVDTLWASGLQASKLTHRVQAGPAAQVAVID